jgi:hypothetical protein
MNLEKYLVIVMSFRKGLAKLKRCGAAQSVPPVKRTRIGQTTYLLLVQTHHQEFRSRSRYRQSQDLREATQMIHPQSE